MTTYRLASSGLVHAPGLLAWGQNGYAFPKDREALLNVFTGTWAGVPDAAFDQLLRKEITFRVEGEVVIFDAYIPTDPVEITEEVYMEALECMPPSRFNRVDGVEMFHICELLKDNLAAWYAQIGQRFFQLNADASHNAISLAARVKAAAQP